MCLPIKHSYFLKQDLIQFFFKKPCGIIVISTLIISMRSLPSLGALQFKITYKLCTPEIGNSYTIHRTTALQKAIN